MTTKPPDDEDLDEFVGELVEFAHQCGSPTRRELAKASAAVVARHKKEIPVLRALSLTSISDTLNRQRKGPPAWAWVATYVLTCLHHAARSGIDLGLSEREVLTAWQERYRRLRSAGGPLPLSAPVPPPVVPAPRPGDVADLTATGGLTGGPEQPPDTPPPESPPSAAPSTTAPLTLAPSPLGFPPDSPTSATALAGGSVSMVATAVSPGGTLTLTEDRELELLVMQFLPVPTDNLTQRRYRRLFGELGVELLIAAEAGDSDAAARLGILLLCRDHPAEADAWLRSAADAGEETAQILQHTLPGHRCQMAAELAYELTLPGYHHDRPASGHPEVPGPAPTGAEVYYRSAAQAGHPGAAYRLALMLDARGDRPAFHRALVQAAAHDHPQARDHYQTLFGRHAPVCPGPHRLHCTTGPCWPPRPDDPHTQPPPSTA